MVQILKLLVLLDTAALAAALYLGLKIDSNASALSHVSAGVLATIFTCFIHCLALFFLTGSARAMKDAIDGRQELLDEFVPLTKRLRQRAYPPATFAILFMLLAAWAGAYVHSDLLAAKETRVQAAIQAVTARERGETLEGPAVPVIASLGDDEREALAAMKRVEFPTLVAFENAVRETIAYPVRAVPLWWIHLAVLSIAIVLSYRAFFIEFELIAENGVGIRRLNAALAALDEAPEAPSSASSSPPGAGTSSESATDGSTPP